MTRIVQYHTNTSDPSSIVSDNSNFRGDFHKMRKVTTFWFRVGAQEAPDGLTDDIDNEINSWAEREGAVIVNTSMCIDQARQLLLVIVTSE